MKAKTKDFFVNFKGNSAVYLKTNILFMTFVISSLINGCLLRFFTVKNYFDIKPIIADLAVILIIGAFGYFIKPKHQFKYYIIWSIIFSVLCLINCMYYTNFLSFVSFSLLETSLQTAAVSDAIVDNVMEMKDFFFLWQILAMFIVNNRLKKKNYFEKVAKIERGKRRALGTLVAALFFVGIFVSTLTSVDISRLAKQWNREYIVMKFGVYTYQFNDLFATVKSTLNPLFGFDENNKMFREYYENIPEHQNNEYTNIFKGKNVIVIHAESIQQYVLDLSFNGEPVAPNLKKLASEGLYFSNFYAQESVGTSSDTEFTLNTSLMPASSGTVFVSYFDREYLTMEKLLKEQGYYTFSMHGNNCTFWNRQAAHKSFGYDDFYCYKKDYKIDETIGLGLADKSFFKQSVPIIKKINKKHSSWFGTLIMLTNHTPFSWIEDVSDYEVNYKTKKINEETGEEEEVVYDYMEGTKLGSYFKSVHYADEALGELFEKLDKEGLLDNTVVVIYGDHDAKLKKSEFNYFYNYNFETGEELDSDDPNYHVVDYFEYELNRKVPLIIWTKDSKENEILNKEITKVMGMYDVLPTLGNMMGFSSKYALGHDIFSINENTVVFPDGNWLTDKMYYSQSKGEGKILSLDETISEDYITEHNKIADEKIAVSNAIIVYDLIKKSKTEVKK